MLYLVGYADCNKLHDVTYHWNIIISNALYYHSKTYITETSDTVK